MLGNKPTHVEFQRVVSKLPTDEDRWICKMTFEFFENLLATIPLEDYFIWKDITWYLGTYNSREIKIVSSQLLSEEQVRQLHRSILK